MSTVVSAAEQGLPVVARAFESAQEMFASNARAVLMTVLGKTIEDFGPLLQGKAGFSKLGIFLAIMGGGGALGLYLLERKRSK